MSKLNGLFLSSSWKHNMESRYVIGLSLQESEHKRNSDWVQPKTETYKRMVICFISWH